MTYTARKLVARALRLCMAVEPGEAPDGQEENDALETLNQLIDSWNTERLLLPFTLSQNYNTVAGKAFYTIGVTGADWIGQRPQNVLAVISKSGGIDYNLSPYNYDEYTSIPDKTVPSPLPEAYFYERTYPLGKIWLYPVPSVILPITVACEAQLGQLTLDSDVGVLPPGYIRALAYNLAVDLGPEYKKVSDEVKTVAKQSKDAIKRNNSKSTDAKIDHMLPMGGSRPYFNWRTG